MKCVSLQLPLIDGIGILISQNQLAIELDVVLGRHFEIMVHVL